MGEEISIQNDPFKQLDDVTKDLRQAQDKLLVIEQQIKTQRKVIEDTIKTKSDELKWSRFRPEYLTNFIEEPYIIEPFRTDQKGSVIEWRVYVPKLVEFSVGRLERASHSFNVYAVNQYMRWFAEIPAELESRFPQLEINLKVDGNLLESPPEKEEEVKEKYKRFIFRNIAKGRFQIKKGSEWELIAQILEDGGLPFVPKGVDPTDFRDASVKGFGLHAGWVMRDYQKEALDRFTEYGAIGIYWPFGCGKSEFGLDLCDRIKGPKLIIAGGSGALREQWIERLKDMPEPRRRECAVVVYQSQSEIERLTKQVKEWSLIIYDECHHLPAKTFMRLSTISTKYRLGLTGSPYREDGHINYIMALTGYPMGLAWSKFVTQGIITLAQVQIHVVKTDRAKLGLLDQILKRDLGKTLIFSDSLDLGKKIADQYGYPWVYGGSQDRIETVRNNERIVISRVGDEGLSIPTIDTVIEVDFLGGSRAQALQRVGRLQHRENKERDAIHHVLVTEDEAEAYGKRLLAYYDKGYKVDWLYGY